MLKSIRASIASMFVAHRRRLAIAASLLLVMYPTQSAGADIGVSGFKLVIIDRTGAPGSKSMISFKSLDANIRPEVDGQATSSATLVVFYPDDPSNKSVEQLEPAQGKPNRIDLAVLSQSGFSSAIAKATFRPGKAIVKLKSLGSVESIALVGRAAPGPRGITVMLALNNIDGRTFRMCTNFPTSSLKPISGGAGLKLSALGGVPTTCPTERLDNGQAMALISTVVSEAQTGRGLAEFFLKPPFSEGGYLNAVIDLDRDGLEESIDSAHGGDWWIVNFPVFWNAAGSQIRVSLPLDLKGLNPVGHDYNVYSSYTASPVPVLSLDSMLLTPGLPFVSRSFQHLQGVSGPDTFGATSSFSSSASQSAMTTHGNASSTCQSGGSGTPQYDRIILRIPAIKQDFRACGPTAAAQSLEFLAQDLNFSLPADLVSRLKGKMVPSWNKQLLYPGVKIPEFVSGKRQLIQDLGLPLKVYSLSDAEPKFSFIRDQLLDSADVELFFHAVCDGVIQRHVVTVAGYFGVDGLWIQDPLDGHQNLHCYQLLDDGTLQLDNGCTGTADGVVATNIPHIMIDPPPYALGDVRGSEQCCDDGSYPYFGCAGSLVDLPLALSSIESGSLRLVDGEGNTIAFGDFPGTERIDLSAQKSDCFELRVTPFTQRCFENACYIDCSDGFGISGGLYLGNTLVQSFGCCGFNGWAYNVEQTIAQFCIGRDPATP